MDIEVLQRIRSLEKDGIVTTQAVIADAEDPQSPLHPFFEWDNDVAADSWRIEQARRLIRSVRLVIHERSLAVRSVAYIKDPDSQSGYVSTLMLRTDRERARRALFAELERAHSAMTRAYDVAESVGVSNEVESIRAQIMGVKTAI